MDDLTCNLAAMIYFLNYNSFKRCLSSVTDKPALRWPCLCPLICPPRRQKTWFTAAVTANILICYYAGITTQERERVVSPYLARDWPEELCLSPDSLNPFDDLMLHDLGYSVYVTVVSVLVVGNRLSVSKFHDSDLELVLLEACVVQSQPGIM